MMMTFQIALPSNCFSNSSVCKVDVSNAYFPSHYTYPNGTANGSTYSIDESSGIYVDGSKQTTFVMADAGTFTNSFTSGSSTTVVTFQRVKPFSVYFSQDRCAVLGNNYYGRFSIKYYSWGYNGMAAYPLSYQGANLDAFNPLSWASSFSSIGVINYSVYSSDVILSNTTTSDVKTQNAINNQTSKVEEGNQIAEQGNTIAQENSDTNKDTNNKITSFFSSFFDNLIGIFVPESGFFSQWFSDLNDFMSDKLGFLWSPFDFFITFLNGVYSGSGASGITFPELTWIDGTVIIPETTIDFNIIGGSDFNELRDKIYFATDIILLGAVIHQFYQKIKLVFEGGSD